MNDDTGSITLQQWSDADMLESNYIIFRNMEYLST
jgi:hypothetical protein